MKRHEGSSRSTSPGRRIKRSRSSVGRYDDSDGSPERIRRRRTPPSPVSHRSYRDDYAPPPRSTRDSYPPSYKVLCVSSFHPKASDEQIKDTLYREFKRYGDITIKMSHDIDHERVAYVCFRSSEDAREAKHARSRINIYDKLAIVEPVYESRPREVYRRQRSRSLSPEYDRYYRGHSPLGGDPYSVDRYERGYPPPGALPHDYRRDVPPVLSHDYMRLPVHRDPYSAMRHAPLSGLPPYGPPPRGFPHGSRPRPYGDSYGMSEAKKDKFPNYLHHVAPEDDPLATRTLFAGNLEIDISEEELRRIFERFGIVEDIDIKRPPPGTGNAFAFVRFQNLDMAHRAKVELSGQYIGKFQCKIGYGKATPTTRIWIGGLGSWTSMSQLETEFDRFGAIQKVDYVKGDSSGYIQYDTIDAAQAAVKEMRGFSLGGQDHRLRVDFADVPGMVPSYKTRPASSYNAGDDSYRPPGTNDDFRYNYGEEYSYRGRNRGLRPLMSDGRFYPDNEWPRPEFDKNRRSGSRDRMRSIDSDSGSEGVRNGNHVGTSRSLADLGRRCASTWQGSLILKNSLFPAKLHLTNGDPDLIETLMRDEDGKPILRITQRLRLDQPKLDDVSKRITSSTAHAIFLGLSGTTSSDSTIDDKSIQTRPLRNLVSYLKTKEAAGVISLISKETDLTGVLYAFPPCSFSNDLLKRAAPSLSEEALKEDHLVVVVVKGGTA